MKPGFTLIELLVAVAIGGVLLTGALAAYRGMSSRQAVKQAGISFVADTKSIQKQAASGSKPAGCAGTLNGYQLSYISATSFSVAALCSLAAPDPQTVVLPQTVEFSQAFNPAAITFSVLASEIAGAQTIILTNGTDDYQIMIEASGVIRGQML